MAGLVASSLAATAAPTVKAEGPGEPFVPGEKIFYSIKKFGVKVGEATLTFNRPVALAGREVVQITFAAKAANFYDEERIFLDPETFRPLKVERDLNIFGKKEMISEDYDALKGEIRVAKTVGGKTTRQVLKRSGQVDNIYGFIYQYRRKGGFILGDVLKMTLPTRDMVFKLTSQDRFRAAGKDYAACLLESQPKQYQVWFDQGPNRIPLRIDGAVGLASTSLVLSGYQPGATALTLR